VSQDPMRWYDVAGGHAQQTGSNGFDTRDAIGVPAASPNGKLLAVTTLTLANDFAPPSWTWLPAFLRNQHWRTDVTLVDFVTKQRLQTVKRVHGAANVAFSLDGSMFAVAREDGTMTVWPVPPRNPVSLAASLASAFVVAAWALRLGYRRFRRRGASGVGERGPVPA
jgi:hypothetical protein